MENKCSDDNDVQLLGDEDDEEALSLSDLPLIRKEREEEEEEENVRPREIGIQEDFDFCSLSKESEMCAADEVFFQGQILPLRHSVSSETGLLQYCDGRRRPISRSESMDHCCSGGLISSRSSSISSHQSSSSGSSASTARPKYKPGLPPRIQFHSHPSPSPRIVSNRQGTINTNYRNFAKKSSAWNIFRLGLVTAPPEIAFQDFKTRCPTNSTNCKKFGSRNSTSSNGSSISSGNSNKKIKNKPRSLLGGCKCSVDAVDTVPSRVVIIKRNASDSNENVEEMKSPKLTKKQAAKKQLSHHRTFEWLKQLSLEGAVDEA
ncbi:hypothetical protein Sango_1814300 [Sesamum angolense]|uniref:Uncharacterized protein n=1 Tax=Sesamum angolense TaxID=2727404 RepID=A0AAE1WHI0_9LAMI|nr:hypothetical protein Sango_1814300 [Sesamum angolense]